MNDKRNNFVCIGAVHRDYILKLQKNYLKNRTNPVNQSIGLGGVAYNVAEKLAFLNLKTELISLNCLKEEKKIINKKKINFFPLNKKIYDRSYTSIINNKGEMILGLANMNNYDNVLFPKNKLNLKNKIIIFDLNFPGKIIEKLINKFYNKNYICVCGTSAHKINKIKKLIPKINILILNKQESFNLSNKKTIIDSLKYIINKNKNLTVVITNGKNSINAYHNKTFYRCKTPKIKVINENKSGDVMSAFFYYFYYFYYEKLEFSKILSKSVVAGSLNASGYNSNLKNYINMVDRLANKIKVVVK